MIKCDQCDTSFTNKDATRSLRHHKLVKHEGVYFPCGHCEKTFNRQDQLKKHIFQKHDERDIMIKCDQCEATFSNKEAMQSHTAL